MALGPSQRLPQLTPHLRYTKYEVEHEYVEIRLWIRENLVPLVSLLRMYMHQRPVGGIGENSDMFLQCTLYNGSEQKYDAVSDIPRKDTYNVHIRETFKSEGHQIYR